MTNFNNKVDFHAHYLSPAYFEYLDKYEGPTPDRFKTPEWDDKFQLKFMDDVGIKYALLSVSSPSVASAPREEAAIYARRINEEGANLVLKHPDRYGLMGELPLPYIDEAVKEARFCLDFLHADGFGLKTHYAGKYLGCPEFDPLVQFLNERKALVVIHPTMPSNLPEDCCEDVPIPTMEFFMDTTRTFTNMVTKDIFNRFPDIKWVFPHAGAFISVLSDRFKSFSLIMKAQDSDRTLDYHADMKHVYFDLAGFPLPKQLEILRKDVPVEHLLYGSDEPYTPKPVCMALAGQLEVTPLFTEEERKKVFTDNAIELLPKLENIIYSNSDSPKDHTPKGKIHKLIDAKRLLAKLFTIYQNR